MAWIARDASASYGRKAILAFIGLSSLIFTVQSIMGIASGAIGQMTYIDLIVQVLFTAGGLYFLSKEKGF
jgi:TM2 domain-containing membrane protein YozV